jgi:lysophospholipase L1-like esterase
VAVAAAATVAVIGTGPASAAPAKAPAPAGHAPAHRAPRPVYYLALGDSLSQGVQPATDPLPAGDTLGQSIETGQGYANDLYDHYQQQFHGTLRLEKLGCPGETTSSMLTGTASPCSYPQGSQLAAAVAFIKAHRGEIGLITIDIGANNVDGCVTSGSISTSCVTSGVAALQSDLPQILGALRSAAGKKVPVAGMNLYDPFLADYLTGSAGQAAAAESVTLAGEVNQLIGAADKAAGATTADVQDAFGTSDSTDTAALAGAGTVPLNVARICDWTWMCAPAPVGPNIHANAAGYRVIATAFERAIGRLR